MPSYSALAISLPDDDQPLKPGSESGLIIGKADYWLIVPTIILIAVSCLMVYSTTAQSSFESHASSLKFLNTHLAHILVGFVGYFLAVKIPLTWIKKAIVPGFLCCLFLLMVVLIPGIGQSAGGAQRWLMIGPLRFQPGEIVKLCAILYISSYIGRHNAKMSRFIPGTVVPFIVIGAMAVLLLLEPDFGSTAIVSGVIFCQLLMVSRISHLVSIGIVAAAAAASLVLTSPYRMKRLEAFLDPLQNASGSGYQLVQSLVAISKGGILGEGLGAGRQKLYYLPAAHTDFIFSMIAEELGFIGSVFVIITFIVIGLRGLRIARRLQKDYFLCSLAVGLTMLIVLPAILNIGVVTGLLPTKGLVLPLVAYGGTAMVVNLFIMGLLTSISRYQVYE